MKTHQTGNSENPYHAYLLKIWQEYELERPNRSWRFSLEDAHTGIRRGFSDLDALLIYLQDLVMPHPDTAE